MEKMHIREVAERFNLYDEKTGRGVTCIISSDGTYEVINRASSTVGKAENHKEAFWRCRDVAFDYFKYDLLQMNLSELQKLVAEISSGIEHR